MTHTRNEIMAMSAENLWLAVARYRGYDYEIVAHKHPSGEEVYGWTETVDGKKYRALSVPNWATEMSSAWDLVIEMIANDRKFHLLRFGYLPSGSPKKHEQKITWEVCYGEQDENLLEYAKGDTAPIAICRAWLMWKEAANA